MLEHSMEGHELPDQLADTQERFWAMHHASRVQPPTSEKERRALLKALRGAIVASRAAFVDAIARDYGWRSHDETVMAEIVPALTLVGNALANLHAWMRPEPRGQSIMFWPGRNRVYWQPKGVALIISPWNYPMQLAVGPLAAALAAGNRVILKPSEFTPLTTAVLKQTLEAALGPGHVTVATGGAETAQALCRLPFDHIFFTGSAAVGKKVMAAAAENLTPVTLELGGKSPAIVHADFDLATAAERIVRGKLLNAGQTCIAPDYVLLARGQAEAFIAHFQATVRRFYPRLIKNRDYTSIINARHYERLTDLVADARTRGARIIPADPAGELPAGTIGSSDTRKIVPIAMTSVTDDMAVMQEEIFGPLLPIIEYDTLDDAIAHVNQRPRPLALYYFDRDQERVDQVLQRTVSGGVTVNDTIYHFAQEQLPFGGIGPSGLGAYHGRDGFRTFSHAKGVFFQSSISPTALLTPPYDRWFRRLIRFAVRRYGRP